MLKTQDKTKRIRLKKKKKKELMELEMPQEILQESVFQKHKIYTKKNL